MLAVLDDQERSVLVARFQRRTLAPGEYAFRQGDPGEDLFLIVDGSVQIKMAVDGREVTLAVLGAGAFFGEMALLDGHPRSASAMAMGECGLLALGRADFLEVVGRSPVSMRHLLAFLSERLRRVNERLGGTSRLTIRRRLAALLWESASEGLLLPPEVTHRRLAERLGASRETVTRENRVLRDLGLVRQEGRRIRVLDPEALRVLAFEG